MTLDQSQIYYEWISRIAQRSGTPVVLDASARDNKPIVDTPPQAVSAHSRNEPDILVLGPFVTAKLGVNRVQSKYAP